MLVSRSITMQKFIDEQSEDFVVVDTGLARQPRLKFVVDILPLLASEGSLLVRQSEAKAYTEKADTVAGMRAWLGGQIGTRAMKRRGYALRLGETLQSKTSSEFAVRLYCKSIEDEDENA